MLKKERILWYNRVQFIELFLSALFIGLSMYSKNCPKNTFSSPFFSSKGGIQNFVDRIFDPLPPSLIRFYVGLYSFVDIWITHPPLCLST